MMKRIHARLSNQKGSVMFVVAFSLIALLGISAFVIDLGSSYHKASALQNGLDSAALAGVYELRGGSPTSTASAKWTAAETKAIEFASLNGYTVAQNHVSVEAIWSPPGARIMGVRVSADEIVPYSFARVFGLDSGTVHRSASAMLEVVDGLKGVIPFYIAKKYMDSVAGTTIIMSSKDLEGATGGRIGPVYMNASESGYSTIGNNVVGGYPGYVDVGQKLYTKTGAFAANLKNDIKLRLDTKGPVAMVPIADRYYQGDTNENGIFESNENMTGDTNLNHIMDPGETWVIASLKVVGFAAMELTYPQGNPDFTITAKFISVVPRDARSTNLGAVDYGVYTANLTN